MWIIFYRCLSHLLENILLASLAKILVRIVINGENSIIETSLRDKNFVLPVFKRDPMRIVMNVCNIALIGHEHVTIEVTVLHVLFGLIPKFFNFKRYVMTKLFQDQIIRATFNCPIFKLGRAPDFPSLLHGPVGKWVAPLFLRPDSDHKVTDPQILVLVEGHGCETNASFAHRNLK